MSEYLPIIVAAPAAARARLRSSEALPQNLLQDMDVERLCGDHSRPAIYLWPYDIPYSRGEELRKMAEDREPDLPAFFGMDTGEVNKKVQEFLLCSKILPGSVMVHVLFLNNAATDTTPGVRERNETYAQFCSFDEIFSWSENCKQAMDIRFPHNWARSRHILVLIAEEQVIVDDDEVEKLNGLIGKDKTFLSCYFLNEHLEPGPTGNYFYADDIWDVLVGRLLLTMVLSQEDPKGPSKPLWDNPGVKLWRATDSVISVNQESSQAVLANAIAEARRELLKVARNIDEESLKIYPLLKEVTGDDNSLTASLESDPDFKPWFLEKAPEPFFGFFRNFFASFSGPSSSAGKAPDNFGWYKLPVSGYEKQITSPDHWKSGKLRKDLDLWRKLHLPDMNSYSAAVTSFFRLVRDFPGALGSFIDFKFPGNTPDPQKEEQKEGQNEGQNGGLAGIFQTVKEFSKKKSQLSEDSREFKKAQNYYVGRGIAASIVSAVTLFFGVVIWRILTLFKVGFPKIVLLSGMVCAGAVAAYVLVMLLHNLAGIRAARTIRREFGDIDAGRSRLDEAVRKMFLDGIRKRNTLALQSVRFRTLRLAERIHIILDTELQPQLSSLLEVREDADSQGAQAAPAEPNRLREAYLAQTRQCAGTLSWTTGDTDIQTALAKLKKKYISGKAAGSFSALWQVTICKNDSRAAGYFPAKRCIFAIRKFINEYLGEIHHAILEQNIKKAGAGSTLMAAFGEFTGAVFTSAEEKMETLFSGPLADGSDSSYDHPRLLFMNSLFSQQFRKDDKLKKTTDECYESRLLEKTRTAALFYEELDVEFARQPREAKEKADQRGEAKEKGDLVFRAVKRLKDDKSDNV